MKKNGKVKLQKINKRRKEIEKKRRKGTYSKQRKERENRSVTRAGHIPATRRTIKPTAQASQMRKWAEPTIEILLAKRCSQSRKR